MIVSGRFFPQGRGSHPHPSACPPLRFGVALRISKLRQALCSLQYWRGDIPPPRQYCMQPMFGAIWLIPICVKIQDCIKND